ncbi:MATE family efflux transporter [Desulfovibrio inopinatus]|uniref:MATE family efflux transporter n=1 Tax=Desulfovibrio inopinatus TaxID=102109 RepID=UPI00041316FC|nr:MATE family efflux transporter [Desulfovibrio inopinatus]
MTASIDLDSPYRAIWHLAWPQILMMLFHFFVGAADVFVAARLGREEQAAFGMISHALFFFLVLAIATSNGTVAAVSQSIGAGKELRAQRYIGMSLLLGVLLGGVILIVGQIFKDLFLGLLQVPTGLEDITSYILSVFLLLLPIQYLFIITNAVFRARKEVKIPLVSMSIMTILNAIGDFGLGFGLWGLPELGYKGLAWTTFGSVTAGLMFNLCILKYKGLLLRETIPPVRWMRRGIGYLFKVAWPSGLMQVSWQTGYLVLFAITASLPEGSVDALAGMSAGIRIESLLFLPAFALNLTASILVGHYLGAGNPEEAKRFGFRIAAIGVGFLTVLSACIWPFAQNAASIFAVDPRVLAEAVSYLKYNLLSIPFTVCTMILAGSLNGAGATLYNLVAFSLAIWLVRLPTAYVLGHLVLHDAAGVWASMLVSQIVQAFSLLYVFTFKNWQRFSLGRKTKPIISKERSHAHGV